MARSALNLYECAVSISNADSTLWIFKEQPIDQVILINNKTDSLESALVLTSPELLLVVVQVVEFFGGGDRTRTRYLLLAKQPLSQLSYTPKNVDKRRTASLLFPCVPVSTRRSSRLALLASQHFAKSTAIGLVGLVGLEPTTPALSRRCSNQLSYRPMLMPSTSSNNR